ncbi:hypothetical protein F9277_14405 [Vibrio harveyi]|nr:hypothetical protein F9277_14405 [Vibrio harveyi]
MSGYVWEPVVVPLLERSATITPVGIFDHLCEEHWLLGQPTGCYCLLTGRRLICVSCGLNQVLLS